jgi:DNA-binding PadR family transcriptional regulator
MLRDLMLGFVKLHILYHAGREPVYGTGLQVELSRHGYRIGPGTLYPTLHALEEEGYLERTERIVGGRIRKYYTLTPKGEAALEEARTKALELVAEISGEDR